MPFSRRQKGENMNIASIIVSAGALTASLLLSGAVFAEDGVSETEIRIGIIGPFTGNASAYSKIQLGQEAYYLELNEAGGINGRQIKLVRADSGCNEAKGIAAAKKLIEDDRVFLIHGEACSGVAMAIKPIIKEAGIPWVIGGAGDQKIADPVEPNIFQAAPTNFYAARSMVDFALSKPGVKTIGILSHTNDWGHSYREPAEAYLKEKSDAELVSLSLERGATDATAQVLQLKQAGVDFVLAVIYQPETAIFVKQANQLGLNVPILGTLGTSLEDTQRLVGSDAALNNYYVLNSFVGAPQSDKMKQWADLVEKHFPGEMITNYSFVGIPGAIAIENALKALGSKVTRSGFIDAMNNTAALKTEIFVGDLTFTEDDHDGVKKTGVAGFKDGAITLFTSWEAVAE
jgi:branched-chain amino acid transport system substrate-binding protein